MMSPLFFEQALSCDSKLGEAKHAGLEEDVSWKQNSRGCNRVKAVGSLKAGVFPQHWKILNT
jgi:hypothetical protein